MQTTEVATDDVRPSEDEIRERISKEVEAERAARELEEEETKLNKEIEEIIAERKSRLKRYVSAKQHRSKLEGIAKKLDEVRGNYMVRHSSLTLLGK